MFVTLMNYNVVHKSVAIQRAIIDGYHVATFVLREAVRKKFADFEDIVLITETTYPYSIMRTL